MATDRFEKKNIKNSYLDTVHFKASAKGYQLNHWYTSLEFKKEVRAWCIFFFFFKFSSLSNMCWVAEGTSDLGNCWKYKWSTNNHEGFSEYIRIQLYNVETWSTSQPAYLRTAENEGGWEHMGQQLGAISRISPAAWELSNGQYLTAKACILLRDLGVHENMKGGRLGLGFWTKEEYRNIPPS